MMHIGGIQHRCSGIEGFQLFWLRFSIGSNLKKKRKGHLKKYLKSTGRTLRHYLQQSYRNQTYHKNLAEFQHFRHFLQESFKRLTFQTKFVCFLQIRDFLQVQAFLTRFLDGSCKKVSETCENISTKIYGMHQIHNDLVSSF